MANNGLPPVSSEEKRVNIIIAVVAIVIGVLFAVYCWQVLPETVSTQFKGLNTGAPSVPKFIAVLVPFAITVLSAISSINYRKQAWVCLIGYAANILFLLSN